MSRLHATGRIARGASVLALGALALHELRYLAVGQGGLATGDHSYLQVAAPGLVALAVGVALATLAPPLLAGLAGPSRRGVAARAVLYALSLLAVFTAQELSEQLLAGHGAAPWGLLTAGGWIVLPLALGLGALSAAVVRLLEGAEALLVRAHHRRRRPRAPRGSGDRKSVV